MKINCTKSGNIPDYRFFSDKKLNTRFIGKNLKLYEITASTNTLAKENSHMPDGTVFVANEQTAGRGRLGRVWNSRKDGVWFSVLLKPNITPDSIQNITLVMAVAVKRVIENSCIKWPNDIVVNSKKVCGILTESCFEGDCLKAIIVGIGVNVNTEEFPEELKDIATSIYLETGKKQPKAVFLAKLLEEIEKCYTLFLEKGFEAFLEEYKNSCATLNRTVKICKGNEEYIAEATDVTKKGELIVRQGNKNETISFGEVSVRGLLGYI